MNRRDFAKLAALGVAGISSVGRLRSAETSRAPVFGANDRINVALIGAGTMGGKTHLPSLVGSPQCQLVAICEVDAKVRSAAIEKAKALYAERNGSTWTGTIDEVSDFRDLLGRREVDAVVVATPDHWHVPIAKAAVRAGKDVYVEKPLSLYVTEGRELVDLAQERGAIVQVGSQQRSDERFIIASEFVRNGLLGEVKHVDVSIQTRSGKAERWEPQDVPPELDYDRWVGPAPWSPYHPNRVHYDFRFVPLYSGGEIANWGAHFLDTAQMGLGMDDSGPVEVRGMGQRNPVGSIHSSFFDLDVDYTYGNGITMKLHTGRSGVTFFGTRGQLFVNREELRTDPPELVREYRQELSIRMRKTKGGHLENWFACVRSRRAQDLHAPVQVGHQSAILCHLANISVELGRPLRWDPEREDFFDDAAASAMLNRPVRKGWEI
jgi:predicted dehydrogenase